MDVSPPGTLEAVHNNSNSLPNITLVDIEMPGVAGLSVAEALHKSLLVIPATFARRRYLRRAIESGLVGSLLKDAPADHLAITIHRVMAGERVVEPSLRFLL